MLLKRSGIFYFRWQIPVELRPVLGRRELVKSLRTRDRLIAECRAVPLRLLVHRVKQLRSKIKVNDLTPEEKKMFEEWETADKERLEGPHLTPLTDSNLTNALGKLWEFGVQEVERGDRFLARDLEELEAYKQHLSSNAIQFSELLLTQAGSLDADGPISLRSFLWECQGDLATVGYKVVADSPLEDLLREYIKIQGFIANGQLENYANQERELFKPPLDVIADADNIVSDFPLFSEIAEAFSNHKREGGLSGKMLKDYERHMNDWSSIMPDKPIDQYHKKELKAYLVQLKKLPVRNRAAYKGKPIVELLEMSDIPEEHLIKDKTVKEVRKWLQGVFRFAIDEYELKTSPVWDLKIDFEPSKTFSSYSDNEIGTMLEKVGDLEEWQRWVLLIAIYTGMRRGEIVQLRGSNVLYDSDSGHPYIMITDKDFLAEKDERDGQAGEESRKKSVKTRAGIRQVPVHPELVRNGFLELATNKPGELFEDIGAEKVTGWFSGFRAACGISQMNDFGERKVFHSFRHTVITKLIAEGNTETLVQQVVGHEKSQLGVTNTYIHRVPIALLIPVIDSLEYKRARA